MLRRLNLSTHSPKETNAQSLLQFLSPFFDRVSTPTLPSGVAGGAPVPSFVAGKSSPTLEVFLHVHDLNRATFIEHAQHLYSVAFEKFSSFPLSVIPTPSAEEKSPVLFTAASISSCPGFSPLYRYIALGGTFDRLHFGHKLLLCAAALYTTERLLIGVTGRGMVEKKKFVHHIEPVETRQENVRRFLQSVRQDLKVEITTIEDAVGGTDAIPALEGLIVSPETQKAVEMINERRRTLHQLKPIVAIVVPYVQTADGRVLSSTELRRLGLSTAD